MGEKEEGCGSAEAQERGRAETEPERGGQGPRSWAAGQGRPHGTHSRRKRLGDPIRVSRGRTWPVPLGRRRRGDGERCPVTQGSPGLMLASLSRSTKGVGLYVSPPDTFFQSKETLNF